MHSSRPQSDQWVTPFPNRILLRRAKQGHDVIIRDMASDEQTAPEVASDNSHLPNWIGAIVAQHKVFGTCCKDMSEALTLPEQRFLFVREDTGVLYLTVGGVKTDQGMGWFDQAVLFCPFCGTQIQTRDEIKSATA